MSIDSSAFHVLVIGGGNCGLGIATGLKKAGIKCTIFERDTAQRYINEARDWGTLLHWGTEYFEKLLPDHLKARVNEVRVDPNLTSHPPQPYMKADTGEVLKYIETPGMNRVSRRKVRKMLTDEQDLNIKFGMKLKSVSVQGETVTAEFEDGTRESGSMLVGCDGSHSVVRSFLVGADVARMDELDHTMINHSAGGYTPSQCKLFRSFHPTTQLCFNHDKLPGGALLAVMDAADPDDTTNWRFQLYYSWSGPPHAIDLQDPAVRSKFVRETMAQFCEPYRTAFLALPDDDVMPVYPTHQWAPRMKWDNHGGRVTIAGDAAHTMLPHRGQGFNNAIKDASDIVDAIKAALAGTTPLAEGITAYEDEMRVRGSTEVDLSFKQMLASNAKDLIGSPMFTMGHAKNDGTN